MTSIIQPPIQFLTEQEREHIDNSDLSYISDLLHDVSIKRVEYKQIENELSDVKKRVAKIRLSYPL